MRGHGAPPAPSTDNCAMGEFDLLERLRRRLPASGPRVLVGMGDDAAVTVPGGATATSVDAIVDGVHFRRQQAPLGTIGRKGLAAALSDLAAMGAEPGEAYVSVGVPADLDEEGCIALLDGIIALAGETGVTLAGGDVTRSPVLSLGFTVVGHAPAPERFVTRAGAKPGDLLVLTGELGGAAAGLLLLERPELAAAVEEPLAAALRRRLLEPVPRLSEGKALAATGAGAMIDLSDGLGADAGHVAAESGVLLRIDMSTVPLSAGVEEVAVAAAEEPLRLAAGGGEDYELLASVPAARLDEAIEAVAGAGRLTPIGEVVEGSGVELRLGSGRRLEPTGYDQLR
jgi:thiamine-monophosphate kinase